MHLYISSTSKEFHPVQGVGNLTFNDIMEMFPFGYFLFVTLAMLS